MKLALITPGGVDRSGSERVIPALLWLIERLARDNEVHVYALGQNDEPGDWDLLGARVHDVGRARGRARRLATRFADEHRHGRFDVVQAFFGWAGAYATLVGWRHRLPVAMHAAGGEFVALPEVAYGMRCTATGRLGLRLAVAGARRVTVATQAMAKLAADRHVPTRTVPLGVAIDRWPLVAPRPRDPTQPLRLLHVGDLRPVKDQWTLLRAAMHLRDARIPFELDIVGRDTMQGVLQRSLSGTALAEHTRWHGTLDRGRLHAMMCGADLLVVSSRHEAGPVVVLEAAVAGVPTVGTAVGHVAEWAPLGAVAVPVCDAAALAREIATLAADEPKRLALACEAQRRALAMDADSTSESFQRIYEELIA